MKHSNKLNTAKLSTNQRVGYWQEQDYKMKQNALEVAKNTPDEIKNTNIKFLLKR